MRCRLRRCISLLIVLLMILLIYRYAITKLDFGHKIQPNVPDVTIDNQRHHANRSLSIRDLIRASETSSRYQQRRQCLAVLTGHPRVGDRLEYVFRLLRQIRQQVVVDIDDVIKTPEVGEDECQNPTDVFVYCDGDCGATLRTEFSQFRWIEFRQLSNHHQIQKLSVDNQKSADANSQSQTINLRRNPSTPTLTFNVSSDKKASVIDEKSTARQRPRSRLFRRQRGDRQPDDVYIELSGIRFFRDRWMSVSKNYRRMFDDLFLADQSSPTSSLVRGRYGNDDSYCAILEDDLILAPDALIYLQAVERLMALDPTVFTGSLFNDNSYPLYAFESQSFQRVDHFAGLGFVMSSRRYVTELRPTWGGLQNWDEAIQRFVARRRLQSVVPEVSRALHVRRRDQMNDTKTTLGLLGLVPRHPFESQRLNEVVHKSGYDLGHVTKNSYDQRLVDMIKHGVYVDHIADALFFHSVDDVIVYWHCSGDSDLNRLLVERDLWGVGNGGVVRGSYRGTLQFRYLTALVLVVCGHSDFRSLRVDGRPSFRIDDYVTAAPLTNGHPPAIGRPSTIGRPYLGIVHRLSVDFRVVVGQVNQSCHSVCERAGNESMTSSCDIRGLWLINEWCDVVKYFIAGCKTCSRGTIDTYVDGVLPAVETDSEGGKCARAYPHFISCHTASPKYRRLCVCQR